MIMSVNAEFTHYSAKPSKKPHASEETLCGPRKGIYHEEENARRRTEGLINRQKGECGC